MEIVPRKTDVITEIEEATQFSKFYATTMTYSGEAVPVAHVQVSKKGTGDNMGLEVDDNGEFAGNFKDFPEEDTNLEEGDTLLFIITNEQGYSTYFNVAFFQDTRIKSMK